MPDSKPIKTPNNARPGIEEVMKKMMLMLGSLFLINGVRSNQNLDYTNINTLATKVDNFKILGKLDNSLESFFNLVTISIASTKALTILVDFTNSTIVPFFKELDYQSVLNSAANWAMKDPIFTLFAAACTAAFTYYIYKSYSTAEAIEKDVDTNVEAQQTQYPQQMGNQNGNTFIGNQVNINGNTFIVIDNRLFEEILKGFRQNQQSVVELV